MGYDLGILSDPEAIGFGILSLGQKANQSLSPRCLFWRKLGGSRGILNALRVHVVFFYQWLSLFPGPPVSISKNCIRIYHGPFCQNLFEIITVFTSFEPVIELILLYLCSDHLYFLITLKILPFLIGMILRCFVLH